MARGFNLTAEINLRGPSNIRTVVADIRRQLGTVTASVNVRVNPGVDRAINNLNQALQRLNTNLQNTRTYSNQAVNALNSLATVGSKASSSMNSLPKNIQAASTAVNTLAKNTSSAAQATQVARTEFEEFGRQSALAVRRFAAFAFVTGAIFKVNNAIASGVKEFLVFNKELVRVSQVTGTSVTNLDFLESKITSLATSLGVASQDLIKVSSTLSQAGLSARDTEKALKALALSAMAPSFDSLSDTVEGSIALMRQFDIGAGDLEKALGSINAVAAKFAVEAGDIIAAIQRTGGVFAAASRGVSEGTDALNEFIAVFTSVRQTTRESAETIATGLRTIFTRIQRSDTIDALKEYGISLTDLQGKFVGPYEAVKRLAEGLNLLDPRDLRFSRITEELGGFRQIGKIIPLIQQFTVAQQALVVAQRGQGSLADDAAVAQQALAVKISKVKEEFTALIRSVGQSDSFQNFISLSLDLSSALIKIADSAKNVLPALTAIMAIRGASFLTQFATGFAGGLRKAQPPKKFASGGLVPGSGRGDKVPALLEPGEVVMSNIAANRYGRGNLVRMNKYASGGPVPSKYFEDKGNIERFAIGGQPRKRGIDWKNLSKGRGKKGSKGARDRVEPISSETYLKWKKGIDEDYDNDPSLVKINYRGLRVTPEEAIYHEAMYNYTWESGGAGLALGKDDKGIEAIGKFGRAKTKKPSKRGSEQSRMALTQKLQAKLARSNAIGVGRSVVAGTLTKEQQEVLSPETLQAISRSSSLASATTPRLKAEASSSADLSIKPKFISWGKGQGSFRDVVAGVEPKIRGALQGKQAEHFEKLLQAGSLSEYIKPADEGGTFGGKVGHIPPLKKAIYQIAGITEKNLGGMIQKFSRGGKTNRLGVFDFDMTTGVTKQKETPSLSGFKDPKLAVPDILGASPTGLVELMKKYGASQILTARSGGPKGEMRTALGSFFKKNGVLVPSSNITTLGDQVGSLSTAEKKARTLHDLVKKYGGIDFFDDDKENTNAAKMVKGVDARRVAVRKNMGGSIQRFAAGGLAEEQILNNMKGSDGRYRFGIAALRSGTKTDSKNRVEQFSVDLTKKQKGKKKADLPGLSGAGLITDKKIDVDLHIGTLSSITKKKFSRDVEKNIVKTLQQSIKQTASSIGGELGVKQLTNTPDVNKVLTGTTLSSAVGSVYEGALGLLGAPYLDKTESIKSMDFPFGMGPPAEKFFGSDTLRSIPTDATRTYGGAGKNAGDFKKQIRRFAGAVNKGEFTKSKDKLAKKEASATFRKSVEGGLLARIQNKWTGTGTSAAIKSLLQRGDIAPIISKIDQKPRSFDSNAGTFRNTMQRLYSDEVAAASGSGMVQSRVSSGERVQILSAVDSVLDDLIKQRQLMKQDSAGTTPQRKALGGEIKGISSSQAREAILGKQLSGADMIKAARRAGYDIEELDNGMVQLSRNNQIMHTLNREKASQLLGSMSTGYNLGGSVQRLVFGGAVGGRPEGPSFDQIRQQIIDKYPEIEFGIRKRKRGSGFGYNLTGSLKSTGGLSGKDSVNFQQPTNLKQLQEYSDKLASKLMSPEKFALGGSPQNSVQALLTPGEAVIDPKLASKIGKSKLDRMNRADKNQTQGYSRGGGVSIVPGSGNTDTYGPIPLEVGSYVIRKKATEALGFNKGGSVGRVHKFNKGGAPQRLAENVSSFDPVTPQALKSLDTAVDNLLAKIVDGIVKASPNISFDDAFDQAQQTKKGRTVSPTASLGLMKRADTGDQKAANMVADAQRKQVNSLIKVARANDNSISVSQAKAAAERRVADAWGGLYKRTKEQEQQASLLSRAMSRVSGLYNKTKGPGLTQEDPERAAKRTKRNEMFSRLGVGLAFTAPMIGSQVGQMMGGTKGAATEESVSAFSTFAGIGSQFGGIGAFVGALVGGVAALDGWNRGLRKAENELSKVKIGQEGEKAEKSITKLEKEPRNQAITDSIINNLDTMASEEASIQKRNTEMREPTMLGRVGAGLQTAASYATFGLVSEGRAGPPRLGTKESEKLIAEIGQTNAAESKARADSALKTLAAKGSSENLTIEQALGSLGGNAAKIQESIASGNVEYATKLEKLSQLAGIGAISASELEQRKKSLIQKYYLQETEGLKAAMADKARAMAANKVAKALNIAVTSIDRTFGNMEAALNRGSDALANAADKLESASLDRASTQASFSGQNILENPRAYSRAERRGAVSQAAGSFGPDMAFVERLSSVGNQIKDSVTSIGAKAQSAGTNKEQTAQEVQRTVDKQLEAAFGNNDLTRQLSQQVKIAIEGQLKDSDSKELDIDKLLSESTGLTSIIEAEKKAFELLAQATKQATQAIDLYSSQVSKAVEMLNEADNISAEGTAMRASNDFRLREMFGQKIPVRERLAARKEEAASRAGVKPDQFNLNALMGQLQTLRQTRSDVESRKANFQSGRDFTDPKTVEGLSKFNSTLISLNNQVDRTKNALKNLPRDIQGAIDDVAGAMQERLGRIESQRQAGSGFAEKLATSTPDELRDLNSTYNILSGALNGQIRTIQQSVVAQQAYQKTIQDGGTAMEAMSAAQNAFANENRQAFSMFSELIEVAGIEKPQANNMRADLLESMAKSQGMNMQNNPIFNKIIENLRQQPGEDPEIKRLETLYKQLQDTQQKALENSRQIVLEDSANLIKSAGEEVKKAIETARISFNEQQLNDMGLGLSRPAQVMGKADGGMIYASTGKLINFQPKGTDTVPAMLTPGEFVVNARSTQQNLPLLQSINKSNGGPVQYFARGTSKPVSMSRNSSTSVTTLEESRNIFDDIMRRHGSPVSESAAKPRPATTSAAKPRPAVAGAATPRPTTAVAPQTTAVAAATPRPAAVAAVTSVATPRPAVTPTSPKPKLLPDAITNNTIDDLGGVLRNITQSDIIDEIRNQVISEFNAIAADPLNNTSRTNLLQQMRQAFANRLAANELVGDPDSVKFKIPDIIPDDRLSAPQLVSRNNPRKPNFITNLLSNDPGIPTRAAEPFTDIYEGFPNTNPGVAPTGGRRARILPTSASFGQRFGAFAGDTAESARGLGSRIGAGIESARRVVGSGFSAVSNYAGNVAAFANSPYAGLEPAETLLPRSGSMGGVGRGAVRTARGAGKIGLDTARGLTRGARGVGTSLLPTLALNTASETLGFGSLSNESATVVSFGIDAVQGGVRAVAPRTSSFLPQVGPKIGGKAFNPRIPGTSGIDRAVGRGVGAARNTRAGAGVARAASTVGSIGGGGVGRAVTGARLAAAPAIAVNTGLSAIIEGGSFLYDREGYSNRLAAEEENEYANASDQSGTRYAAGQALSGFTNPFRMFAKFGRATYSTSQAAADNQAQQQAYDTSNMRQKEAGNLSGRIQQIGPEEFLDTTTGKKYNTYLTRDRRELENIRSSDRLDGFGLTGLERGWVQAKAELEDKKAQGLITDEDYNKQNEDLIARRNTQTTKYTRGMVWNSVTQEYAMPSMNKPGESFSIGSEKSRNRGRAITDTAQQPPTIGQRKLLVPSKSPMRAGRNTYYSSLRDEDGDFTAPDITGGPGVGRNVLDDAVAAEQTGLKQKRERKRVQQQAEERKRTSERVFAAIESGGEAMGAVSSGAETAIGYASSAWNWLAGDGRTERIEKNRKQKDNAAFKGLYDNASRIITGKPRLPGQIEEFKTLGLERAKLEQELAEISTLGAPTRIGLNNQEISQKTDEIKSRITNINNKIVEANQKTMGIPMEESDRLWKEYNKEKQQVAIKAEKKERGLAIRKQAAIDSSLESVTRMRVPKDPEKLAEWRSKALEKIRQKFYLSGDPSSDIKMMTAYGLSPDLANNLFRPMNEQQNEAVYDLLSQQTQRGVYKYSDQDLQLLRLSRKEIIQRVTEGKVARPQDLIKRKEQLETAREKEFGKATKAMGRIDSLAEKGMGAQNPRVQENFRKNLKKKLIKSGYIDPRENAATNAQRLSSLNLGANTVSFIYPNQAGGMLAQAKSSGGMIYASAGQLINFQPKGTDTVPAMLTPGEFVVNSRATKQNLPMLQAINKADGGFIGAAEPTQVSQNIRDRISSDIIQKQTLMKLEGVNRKTSNIDSTTKNISDEKLPSLANSTNLYTKQSSSTLNNLSKQSSEINKNTKETAQVLNPVKRSMGGPVYASKGTLVPYQPKGTDTVPAMLTPGEFVVNRAATQQNLPLLRSINSGSIGGYSKGGVVYLEEGGMAGLSERELFLARLEEEQNRKNKLTTQTDTRTGRITRKDAKSGTVMEDSLSPYNKDIGSSDPLKAFGIGAAKGAGPTAAGISAGAYTTAATAPFLGPFAPLAGLGAGITAGMITSFLQEKGLDSLAPEANAEMKRITDENQIASALGSVLPGMGAGIAQQGLASFAGTLGQRFGSGAISATMGSAIEYGATGKVDPSNLGINFGTGFAQPMGGKQLRASTESGSSGASSALLKGNVLSTSPSPQRGPTPLSKLSVATKATDSSIDDLKALQYSQDSIPNLLGDGERPLFSKDLPKEVKPKDIEAKLAQDRTEIEQVSKALSERLGRPVSIVEAKDMLTQRMHQMMIEAKAGQDNLTGRVVNMGMESISQGRVNDAFNRASPKPSLLREAAEALSFGNIKSLSPKQLIDQDQLFAIKQVQNYMYNQLQPSKMGGRSGTSRKLSFSEAYDEIALLEQGKHGIFRGLGESGKQLKTLQSSGRIDRDTLISKRKEILDRLISEQKLDPQDLPEARMAEDPTRPQMVMERVNRSSDMIIRYQGNDVRLNPSVLDLADKGIYQSPIKTGDPQQEMYPTSPLDFYNKFMDAQHKASGGPVYANKGGRIAYLEDGGVAADIGWTRVNARQTSETRKKAVLQAKTRLQNLQKINSEMSHPILRFNVQGLNAFLSAIEANKQDFKFYNDDQFKIPSSDYDDIITDNLTTPYEKAQKLYDKNIGRKNELQNIKSNIRGINLKKPSDNEENIMFTPQLSWAKVYEIKEAQIKAAEQELDQRSEYIKRATEAERNHNPANNERKKGESDPWGGVFGYADGGIVNPRINRLRTNAELPNARTSADRLRANADLSSQMDARGTLGPSPSEIYLQEERATARGVLDKKERPLSRSQALEQLSQFNNKELYSKLSSQEELKKKELEAIIKSKPVNLRGGFLDDVKGGGYQTGGVVYANKGKMINFQPRGTDTVPAMLTPGEFVVNRSATQANLPLLQGINGGATGFSAGGQVNYMADGGLLGQMFQPVMKSFTSLTSSITNTIQALQTYQKQLAGTQPNSVSNTSGRNVNLDGLSVFTNKFDQFIVALNKINIPPMVQLQVAPVTVNITGAEALVQALEGPMGKMLQSQIAQSFARLSASTEGAIQA